MNEEDAVQPEPAHAGPYASGSASSPGVAGVPATAGALLRQARQARGLDIATLSAMLKVPAQKLQALEQDQFDLLLDPVFARALAASVCRILKLDPSPVLQRLPAITAFKVRSQNRGINTPFRTRGGANGGSIWSHISRPAILFGLALLLGALALVFLPFIQREIARYRQAGPEAGPKSELVEPVSITTPVPAQLGANSGAPEVPLNPPGEPLRPAEVREIISAPADLPALPVSVPSAGAQDANPRDLIVFSAKGESWIKVTDAKGRVVLGRTLRTGESASASGVLPMVAEVARADVVQVKVRGQAFGLGSVTKNNMARFEVK